jgi:hypothetical protein
VFGKERSDIAQVVNRRIGVRNPGKDKAANQRSKQRFHAPIQGW